MAFINFSSHLRWLAAGQCSSGRGPAAPGEQTPRRGEAGSPRPLLDGAGGVKMKWRRGSTLQTPRSALTRAHLGSRGRRPGPLGGGGGTSQPRPLLQGARRAEGRLPHPRAAGTAAPSRSRQLPARRGEEGAEGLRAASRKT